MEKTAGENKNKSEAVTGIIVKKKYGSFLENRIVDVKPVESSGKWQSLLSKGQDMNKSPFILNKVKRSYQVPLNSYRRGGGVKVILDDINKILIEKYESSFPEGLTERQFFEKELGVDLNPSAIRENNFWRIDKRGRVTLTKEGTTLNLNLPMDMLRYKILMTNETLISPSYEVRKNKQTYEFMIVDQDKHISQRVELADIKSRAFRRYSEITSNETEMKVFIRSIGRTIPMNYTEDWIKSEILTVLESSEKNFLSIVDDKDYKAKAFIQRAVEVGSINRLNDKRYTLDNGRELGDLTDTINFLEENQELRLRIKSQIALADK